MPSTFPTPAYVDFVLSTVKPAIHPTWFFPNSDLFIRVQHLVFGLHRSQLLQSLLISQLAAANNGCTHLNPITLRGITACDFEDFLDALYYITPPLPRRGIDWHAVLEVAEIWGFPNMATVARCRIAIRRRCLRRLGKRVIGERRRSVRFSPQTRQIVKKEVTGYEGYEADIESDSECAKSDA
jgi:hypothetical protein